jgi:hypothetical protein
MVIAARSGFNGYYAGRKGRRREAQTMAAPPKVDVVSIGFGAVGGIAYWFADAIIAKYRKSPGVPS